MLIETLQTMVLATVAAMSGRDEPASLQELDRLSHILKRIESTDKLRKDRERAAEKAKAEKAKSCRPGQGPGRALAGGGRHHPRGGGGQGASAVAGSPHRHVGAGGPVGSCESFPAIPDNPGESHSIPAIIPTNLT